MKSYKEGTYTIQEFLYTIAALYQPLEVYDEDILDDDNDVSTVLLLILSKKVQHFTIYHSPRTATNRIGNNSPKRTLRWSNHLWALYVFDWENFPSKKNAPWQKEIGFAFERHQIGRAWSTPDFQKKNKKIANPFPPTWPEGKDWMRRMAQKEIDMRHSCELIVKTMLIICFCYWTNC